MKHNYSQCVISYILPKMGNSCFHCPFSSWTVLLLCSLWIPHVHAWTGYLNLKAFLLRENTFQPVELTVSASAKILQNSKTWWWWWWWHVMASIIISLQILLVWRDPCHQRREERTCLASRLWLIPVQLILNLIINLLGPFVSEVSRVSKKLSPTIIALCSCIMRHFEKWVWLGFLIGIL